MHSKFLLALFIAIFCISHVDSITITVSDTNPERVRFKAKIQLRHQISNYLKQIKFKNTKKLFPELNFKPTSFNIPESLINKIAENAKITREYKNRNREEYFLSYSIPDSTILNLLNSPKEKQIESLFSDDSNESPTERISETLKKLDTIVANFAIDGRSSDNLASEIDSLKSYLSAFKILEPQFAVFLEKEKIRLRLIHTQQSLSLEDFIFKIKFNNREKRVLSDKNGFIEFSAKTKSNEDIHYQLLVKETFIRNLTLQNPQLMESFLENNMALEGVLKIKIYQEKTVFLDINFTSVILEDYLKKEGYNIIRDRSQALFTVSFKPVYLNKARSDFGGYFIKMRWELLIEDKKANKHILAKSSIYSKFSERSYEVCEQDCREKALQEILNKLSY